MASGGYPSHFNTGLWINGLDSIEKNATVFHSGTRRNSEGTIVTDGGRLLTVVGTVKNIRQARDIALWELESYNFPHCYFRKVLLLER